MTEWLSTAEAAERLGITVQAIYQLIDSGGPRRLPLRAGHPPEGRGRRAVSRRRRDLGERQDPP